MRYIHPEHEMIFRFWGICYYEFMIPENEMFTTDKHIFLYDIYINWKYMIQIE